MYIKYLWLGMLMWGTVRSGAIRRGQVRSGQARCGVDCMQSIGHLTKYPFECLARHCLVRRGRVGAVYSGKHSS